MTVSTDKSSFFIIDEKADGAKDLVFLGEEILVYRRDTNTRIYPLSIDLPGGGREPGETPFQTFQREVKEEFGLTIEPKDVVAVRHYDFEMSRDEKTGVEFPMCEYFPIVKLPEDQISTISFGNEGVSYMLMSLEEYLNSDETVPAYRRRVVEYAKSEGEE
jgi:8-oxo-dGTP diphosphatase